MFKWFMAKSIIVKIIIVTSSVVVIGGATAGAIIIPKVIEKHHQEQLEMERQAQLEKEKEEDLANMSIVIKEELKTNGVNIALKGVTQGWNRVVQREAYPNLEEALLATESNGNDREKIKKALMEIFVEDYTGGELTVEENVDIYKRGEYPVTFTVTSEKGNTKSETVIVTTVNYYVVRILLDDDIGNQTKTVTKGTNVDIMEGVTFDSILPEEEQGHIETTGTVDVNTVGTYTITYTYIPKDETEGVVTEMTRTYKVVDNTTLYTGELYKLKNTLDGIMFWKDGRVTCDLTEAIDIEGMGDIQYANEFSGTYKQNGENITLNIDFIGGGGNMFDCNKTWKGKISNNGKSVTITVDKGKTLSFSL